MVGIVIGNFKYLVVFHIFLDVWRKNFRDVILEDKVVNPDNQNLSIGQLSIKFVINILTFALCGIPLIFVFLHKDKISLSDYLSNTRVIKHLDS